MSSAWVVQRMVGVQLALALVGMVAFVIYSRSWKDLPHVVYDIPASFAVFAFIAQLVLEVARDGTTFYWLARVALFERDHGGDGGPRVPGLASVGPFDVRSRGGAVTVRRSPTGARRAYAVLGPAAHRAVHSLVSF